MDLRILCTCLAFFVCVGTESTYAYFTPSGAKYSESLSETSKNVTVDEFINAAIVGNAGIIQSFINQGGNPDIEKDYKGRTALMLALKKGYTEIAKLLLQNGADPTIAEKKHGRTAWDYAKRRGYSEIVEMIEKAQR